MENDVKKIMLNYEKNLNEYATYDKDAIRLQAYQSDIRPNYFRDIDRIIHSLSYTRYIDKTQVFSINDNDNIQKRIIHVQLVSKIAKTIGRALSLNEDLIEAIALGHDIGHVPFGHVGESILNKISLENNEGYFMHNIQSVRTFMNIENNGRGSNLTLQVLDGIMCHNGEFVINKYYPKAKTKEIFLEEYHTCYQDANVAKKLVPMTLEGCVVRISDIIGYIGRDIEDAFMLGVLKKEIIPKEITDVLGKSNKEIINTVILDIITKSLNKPYIKMSNKVAQAIIALKKFNYANIYNNANTKEQIEYYKLMFQTVFDYNKKVLLDNNKKEAIYKVFLDTMTNEYIENTSINRIVIDFIAGMTDDYLISSFNHIVNLKKVEKI